VLTLWTNGKFQGDDGIEVPAQRGFAHLPSAFARQHHKALVVGLGTGTTAGAMASYPYERIDVAELSPAIVYASRTFFGGLSQHVLEDHRVRLLPEDGRNVLLVSRERYDVITIELTSIWFAGAANLYSREFYELAAEHLEEGGVLQQWIQLHHTSQRETAVVLRTLRSVFPHVCLFVNRHQGHLLASPSPLTISRERLARLESLPEVRESLAGGSLMEFATGLLLDERGLDRFANATTEIVSTDENLYLEYATPRNNVPEADNVPDTVAKLSAFAEPNVLDAHVTP
jgi:spermidine synthase